MRLDQAIKHYIERRQTEGISFARGRRTYGAFGRTVGDVTLREIQIHHVLQFLGRPAISATGFRREHSLLRHFFEYWAAYGEMARFDMPSNRPSRRSTFLPYVYTKEEICCLLRSTHIPVTPNDKVHHKTLRTAVLTLYATGATVGEVTRLATKDVDLSSGSIFFPRSPLQAARCIPIVKDLTRVVRQYIAWKDRESIQSEFFLPRIDGKEISARMLGAHFGRLRAAANLPIRANSFRPCLRDLRPTFAVHRITSWIAQKENLNRMLPALAAYMGNAGLESTERYLYLAPERFRRALNKLSPPKAPPRWRNDPDMLDFLVDL